MEPVSQEIFPAGDHDSLQYHFHAGPLFFATRVFRSLSLRHSSVWMYDHRTQTTTELLNHNIEDKLAKLAHSHADHTDTAQHWTLEMADDQLVYTERPCGGSVALKLADSQLQIDFSFQPSSAFAWGVSGQKELVLHRPQLRGTLTFNGETFPTTGYSKRYFGPYPEFWGYRFLCGHITQHSTSEEKPHALAVWTADATFGDDKYNYYNLVQFSNETGETISRQRADTENTYQQANLGVAFIEGVKHELRVETLGSWWETTLQSPCMKSRMRQRLCSMTLNVGGVVYQGLCLNEVCFGTLA